MNPVVRGFGDALADHNYLANIGVKPHVQVDREIDNLTSDLGILSVHVAAAEGNITDVTSLAVDTGSAVTTHIGTTTLCPHSGQDLSESSVPTFAGLNLTGAALCGVEPLAGDSLVNKRYVDNLMSYSQTWQKAVKSFYDFSLGDPAGLVEGDRFIALADFTPFTIHCIYTWTSSEWVETVPLTGYCLYDGGTDSNYIFIQSGTWSHMSLSLDHNDLLNRGTVSHSALDTHVTGAVKTHAELDTHVTGAVKTHSEIDSHLGATTSCPHSGQDLRSTADPSFNSLSLTDALETSSLSVTSTGTIDQLTVSQSLVCSPGCTITGIDTSSVGESLTVTNTSVPSANVLKLFQPGLGESQSSSILLGLSEVGDHFRIEYGDAPSYPNATFRFNGRTEVVRMSHTGTYTDIPVFIDNTDDSMSPLTGALKVTGGLGVNKRIFAGSDVKTAGSLTVEGLASFTNSATGTSKLTGALTVAGDIGVAKTVRANAVIADTRLTVLGASGASWTPLLMTNETQADGSTTQLVFGKAWSSQKAAVVTYTHVADGSPTNSVLIGVAGSPGVRMYSASCRVEFTTPATSESEAAFVVVGGIGCTGDIVTTGAVYNETQAYSSQYWNGTASIPTSVVVRKLSNVIQIMATTASAAVTGVTGAFNLTNSSNANTVLPATYRPTKTAYMPVVVLHGTAYTDAYLRVETSGVVAIMPANGGTFTAAVTPQAFAVSYYRGI